MSAAKPKRVPGAPSWNKGKSKGHRWLIDHRHYQGNDCLQWPFARNPRVGRGEFGVLGKRYLAHRFMCELAHGLAPDEKPQAAHSCGNGHKGCVNPRHLSWKSNSENQIDRTKHGRASKGRSWLFTPAQIAMMRSKYGKMTQMQLAEEYECSLGTIQYYLKYREQRGHEPS